MAVLLFAAVVYKAVSANGDLMGVIVNEIMTRDCAGHDDGQEDDGQEDSVNFKKFMDLFQKVERESDVFGKYPDVDRIMHIKMVAVAEAFKGRGVCTALFEKTKYVCPLTRYLFLFSGVSRVRETASQLFSRAHFFEERGRANS